MLRFTKFSFQAPLDDDYYDYSEIWGQEYYDEVDEDDVEVEEVRINFHKYGRKANNTSDDAKEHVEAVPDSIYCDLVTTLNEKCIQVSRLSSLALFARIFVSLPAVVLLI